MLSVMALGSALGLIKTFTSGVKNSARTDHIRALGHFMKRDFEARYGAVKFAFVQTGSGMAIMPADRAAYVRRSDADPRVAKAILDEGREVYALYQRGTDVGMPTGWTTPTAILGGWVG